MEYEKPDVVDYGDLVAITAAGALGNNEDGANKSIVIGLDPIANVSIGILP